MHYSVVEAHRWLKWRWRCSCGRHGEPVRKIRDAREGNEQHKSDVYYRRVA